jgi:hypothetical protein
MIISDDDISFIIQEDVVGLAYICVTPLILTPVRAALSTDLILCRSLKMVYTASTPQISTPTPNKTPTCTLQAQCSSIWYQSLWEYPLLANDGYD